MNRQKLEPGSLRIVYLFQHQLTFTLGLGKNNVKNNKYEKSCIIFLRTPIVTFDTVFFENVLPALIKRIQFNCSCISYLLLTIQHNV